MSAVGGFSGGDALLAFAAIQQGRMNEEMTTAMHEADLRSQMASDLANIKSDLEIANRHPEQPAKFQAVGAELKAFMEKYGSEPTLDEVTGTVAGILDSVDQKLKAGDAALVEANRTWSSNKAQTEARGLNFTDPPPTVSYTTNDTIFAPESINSWLEEIDGKLSASGTNDQLAMIHIKQLNDNINNSSGMVSGIIESRNNSTASIINNIA